MRAENKGLKLELAALKRQLEESNTTEELERLRAENESLRQGVRLSDVNLQNLRDKTLFRIRLGNLTGRAAAKRGIDLFIQRLRSLEPTNVEE